MLHDALNASKKGVDVGKKNQLLVTHLQSKAPELAAKFHAPDSF
ncbi:MAG: hypothetical protein ABJ360_23065 [Roseobacter sp.]